MMKKFLLEMVLWTGMAVQILSAQDVSVPSYPKEFVGWEEVTTILGVRDAGTASIIKTKDSDQCYIISARHLLGPAGGFEKQTPASSVPSFVKDVRLKFFTGGSHNYPVTPLLVPATALEAVTKDPINDLVVYQLKDPSLRDAAVNLAEKVPVAGDPLWVVATVADGAPKGQVTHSLKVIDTVSYIVSGGSAPL